MTMTRQPHRAEREESTVTDGLILTPDERAEADRLHRMLHDSLRQMDWRDGEIAAIRAASAAAIDNQGTGDLPEHAGRDPHTGQWRNW